MKFATNSQTLSVAVDSLLPAAQTLIGQAKVVQRSGFAITVTGLLNDLDDFVDGS